MLDGQIQSLVTDKGFGFIKPTAGGADVFFHYKIVDAPFESLAVGQAIQYELDAKADKPRAQSVLAGRGSAKAGELSKSVGSPRSSSRPVSNSRPRDTHRDADRPGIEHGFVTKLHRKRFRGFISSIKHGPEFVFAAECVYGEKRYSRLEIGDYVEFRVGEPDAEDPKQPVAKAVQVVEREVRIPGVKQLGRHPKARKKKPNWR